MSKRKTITDKAIEDVDQQILVLQKARELLVKQQPKPSPKPVRAATAKAPLLASS